MADHNFRSDRGQDPIAELARLIGQADPHGKSAPADRGWREGTASEGYEEPTRLPPAPHLPGRLNAPRPIRRREPANPVQLMSRWEPLLC
jgi:hypothetical protein